MSTLPKWATTLTRNQMLCTFESGVPRSQETPLPKDPTVRPCLGPYIYPGGGVWWATHTCRWTQMDAGLAVRARDTRQEDVESLWLFDTKSHPHRIVYHPVYNVRWDKSRIRWTQRVQRWRRSRVLQLRLTRADLPFSRWHLLALPQLGWRINQKLTFWVCGTHPST
jgi:hypothetical protein